MNDTKSDPPSIWIGLVRPEMLVAFSAIIISLSALAVSLYETSLIRQAQHASVWPHLMVGHSFPRTGDFMFLVHNTGIGPARIQNVEVAVDGEPVTNWTAMLEALTGEAGPFSYTQSTINSRVLPPGDPYEIFWKSTGEQGADDDVIRQLLHESERYNISVCYCSVYDECWYVDNNSSIPESINECKPEAGRSFEM